MPSVLEEVVETFYKLQTKLQSNPNDDDTLNEMYHLSVNLKNGRQGFQKNETKAEEILEKAAQFGHADACYKLARAKITSDPQQAQDYLILALSRNPAEPRLQGLYQALDVTQGMKKRDEEQLAIAKRMFQNKDGLEDAIKSEIFPCVVSIVNSRSTIGSGFYQHSEWLVSNAHVIPNTTILKESSLIDFKSNQTSLMPERAFHRPSEIEKSPDIVIVQGNSRGNGNNKCIPIDFSDDDDTGQSIFFYVYFNYETQAHEINYLKPHSEPNAFPMRYECEDIEPKPGCSGAPVIAARLLVGGHEIKWQFKTVGVVYARCSSINGKQQEACAIPVRQDFKQILERILHPQMQASRAEHTVAASITIRNSIEKTEQYRTAQKNYDTLATQGLKEFEAGKTELNIDLPNGLEKLLGRMIIDIEESAFISDVQKLYKLETRRHIATKAKTLDELKQDFYNFLKTIASQKTITLQENQNNFMLSPKEYFRIDVAGTCLDIQDNIGNKGEKCPPPHHTEPVSSKFAIAKVPEETNEISGKELANLFIKSLMLNSKRLLKSVAAQQEKKEILTRFQAICYKHGWKGSLKNTHQEANKDLKNSSHHNHSKEVLKVKTSSGESLNFDDSTTSSTTESKKEKPKPNKKRCHS